MASEVDICNLSLLHIGEDAVISSIRPPEGGPVAETCARMYQVARDICLEQHTWNFATRRQTLSEVTNDRSNWQYAYAKPSDCIRAVSILPQFATTEEEGDTVNYVIETLENGSEAIFTNEPDAHIKYIRRVTDTTKFTPLFVNAVSWLLASYLAGPITKKSNLKTSCYQLHITELNKAKAMDSSARHLKTLENHNPEWLRARGQDLNRYDPFGRNR